MHKINSFSELQALLNLKAHVFVLIHKGKSTVSACALNNLNNVGSIDDESIALGEVDVDLVKDVHKVFNVESAPSLLVFEDGELKNVVKGCMDEKYYDALIKGELKTIATNSELIKAKSVIVYSTPTCSWCTKIKDYLRSNNIKFREVDVAANPAMAEEMKRKSGQMGVPQTEINGKMIVGFDRPKIDRLLEIA